MRYADDGGAEPHLDSPEGTLDKPNRHTAPIWRSQRTFLVVAAIFSVVGACILIPVSIRDSSSSSTDGNPKDHNIFTLRSEAPSASPIVSVSESFASTKEPTVSPSAHLPSPEQITSSPIGSPSPHQNIMPSPEPSFIPSSLLPLKFSLKPASEPSSSELPSSEPTAGPSSLPSFKLSSEPTSGPSSLPSLQPSLEPTSRPSSSPTFHPSLRPSPPPSIPPTPPPTSPPTLRPTRLPTAPAIVSSPLMVGAYYYPWYSRNFHGGGYVREHVNQTPALGEYSDRNPAVIAKHLEWSRQSNIRLWVSSWWGPGSREDVTLQDHILVHEALDNMKIALFYETQGRIRGDNETHFSLDRVFPDVQYMCDEYFYHPNYYRIQGRPVVAVYLTRVLESLGLLQEIIEIMRSAANAKGHNVYIIGDHAFGRPKGANSTASLRMLDAVTSYDVYGAVPNKPYALQEGVDRYFRAQDEWIQLGKETGCTYIPGVSPGFNDRGVRLEADHPPLSRRLAPSLEHGTLFEEVLRQALERVQPANIIFVNSFNEWHEDTQIEPVVGPTHQGDDNYTLGVEYIGYGELYLNILKRMTSVATARKKASQGYRLLSWWRSFF